MRIAILRALQLGDLLCAVPFLRSLRSGYPEARIHLVGLAWAAGFAERFDRLLDGFLELPGWPGLPETEPRAREVPAFLARAHASHFDLAVQLHGSGSIVNELTVLLGARTNAGFFEPGGYCPDPETFVPYPERGHEIRRLLVLAETLGLPACGEELELPVGRDDHAELEAAGLELECGTYACVHPGARFPDRRWAPERFAAVADFLAERGLRVVLTGSAAEAPLTAAVGAGMRAPAIDAAGRTSLGSLAALVDGSRLLVSNDTGVAHVAAALRTPSVVVVTTSDPERWAPLDRDLHRAVVRPADEDAVLAAADAQLAKEPTPAGLHLAHPR